MSSLDDLYGACSSFIDPIGSSLWDRLRAGAGYHSREGGHPSAKSRPPATLSVVSLVLDVTKAVQESALDLVRRLDIDVRTDLCNVLAVIDDRADDDLIDWWTTSLIDWAARASQMLGQSRTLLRELRGAACPYCCRRSVRTRVDGEWVSRPCIVVDWDADDVSDVYQVHSLHCRSCGAEWLRGVELDELIARTMRANLALAVLTFDDDDDQRDVLAYTQVGVVASQGRTGGVSPVWPSPSAGY